jgi:hypothetical protein
MTGLAAPVSDDYFLFAIGSFAYIAHA